MVGINIEGKSKEVLDYLGQSGYSFMVLFDSGDWESEVAKRYQVSSIPRTFLIDRDGRVMFAHLGFEPDDEDTLEEEIQKLL